MLDLYAFCSLYRHGVIIAYVLYIQEPLATYANAYYSVYLLRGFSTAQKEKMKANVTKASMGATEVTEAYL